MTTIVAHIVIKAHQHLLPGVGDVEYVFDSQTLAINIAGNEALVITGSKASGIFGHARVIAGDEAARLQAKAMIEQATGYTFDVIRSGSRKRDLVDNRHIAQWWLRNNTSWSYACIGEFFNRDHSSAQHANRRIKNQMKTSPDVRRKVVKFLNKINAHNETGTDEN